MLYFKPFMGEDGQNPHIPAHTIKTWSTELFGADTVPGWSDELTVAENIAADVKAIKSILKNVNKSLYIIQETMRINNIAVASTDFEVRTPASPLYSGFVPYLKIEGDVSTDFARWALGYLPRVSTRNGESVPDVFATMRIVEGWQYLTTVQRDMSSTISILNIIKSYYREA